MLTFLILCLLVGAVVGFLAGLFGIGGGLVIVPTLVYLLPIMGVPEPLLMSTALGTSFATIVIYLAIKMVLSIKPKSHKKIKPLTTLSSIIGGILIGIASSAAGIGGGGFIVPFLTSRGIDMKKAIGSSAFCGMLLGTSGMFSFMLGGLGNPSMPEYSLGYIYLPAVVGITTTSFFTSKLGANATAKLPVTTLKKGFALLLIAIAINMFLK